LQSVVAQMSLVELVWGAVIKQVQKKRATTTD